jgi:glycosyltransferase involved in cell wall biosynthesis
MAQVSCIIPAYNEGPRIGGVLQAVCHHPLIDEIIVVDDGSEDNTQDVVSKFAGIRSIIHEENRGKSQTVVDGLLQSKGDTIFLLDADLIGLTPRDISELIEPVLGSRADIALSMRKNSPWLDRKIGLDFISGERVFSRSLIQDHLDEIRNLPRFGLESYLNKLVIRKRCRIKITSWKNVISLGKRKKSGFYRGLKSDVRMILDILRTISLWEVFYQFVAMSFLKVE